MKNIDYKIQNLVFGYIQNIQESLSKEYNIFNNAPSLINYICLAFFYFPAFGKIPSYLEVSGFHKNIVTKLKCDLMWNCSIFGNQWIKYDINKIIKWKFRYITTKLEYLGGVLIGIVTNKHSLKTHKEFNENHSYSTSI